MGRLSGKIALVSGGSRGMGATHARAIVANDGKVVIGDILETEGGALARELGSAARFIRLDVTKADDWKAAVTLAVKEFGGLNVLVNNAGIAEKHTELEDFTEAQWNTTLGVNLTGTFLGIKAAVGALKASAPSSIINISSTGGFVALPGLHGYVASKFGVRGLTKAVAVELGSSRVRANSIHPGPTRTPLADGIDLSALIGALGRIAEPEEVSNLVVYLASDESSFSTGSEFVVDGGQLAV
ncbi:MAG: SDR family oxidoreductase [Edaphobacter sp.]|jgi:3alpha(or 20beta)-hydroxysteroid dehydrogenase|uniref:SDR family oxidoreductase n=1 Tax=Terracidiphilus sp. TaxID=1964191 RepID=UPI003C1E6273